MKKILNALKGNGCQARMLTAAMAVLSAMAGLTSCANEDTALDNTTARTAEGRTVQFTATLAPKGEAQPVLAEGEGDNGGQTRAITVNDKNTANETLNVAWQKDEKIAVYYKKTNGEHATATAIVGTPNEDGSAPITATLTDAKAGPAKFVYPATLHDDQGDIDESQILNNQNGLLYSNNPNISTISKDFDAAIGSGTIAVSGLEASVSGSVTMTNRVCICKMTLGFRDGSNPVASGGKTCTIGVGDGTTYTISSPFKDDDQPAGGAAYRAFKSGDVIYVAMLPVDSKPVTFTSINGDNKMYRLISSSVKLTAGSFYRNIPLTLTKVAEANKTLTTETGELTLQHGDVLTGTGGENTQLKIAAGATVILMGVTNTGITKAENIAGIECLGDATIILDGTNSVAGREYAPGIFIPQGSTLTIQGSGSLTAIGGSTSQTGSGSGNIGGAGIGGTTDISCGNIVIEGGTITATGTGHSAGIGSGYAYQAANTCGDISISGSAKVTATGGMWAAGIGSGWTYKATTTCGNISISGSAQVIATGGTFAAGIGSGNGYDAGSNIYVSSCDDISITGGTIEARGGDRAAGIGSGSYGKFTSISITSGITRVTATRSNNYSNAPIGKGNDDQGSGAVTFGGVVMHNGTGDASKDNWAYWPEDVGPFGGIKVSASVYDSNGRTWTLTPSN